MAKILFVDDEPCVRRVVRLGLASSGHSICEAADGDGALAQFDAVGEVDPVITDVVMAGKDGIERPEEVRKRREDPKAFVISGGGQVGASNYLRMAGILGANRTLEKPFTSPDLRVAAAETLVAPAEQ
jgi:CheY-like chemotaxis protein